MNSKLSNKPIVIFILIFFIGLQNIHSIDIEITGAEIEANLGGEYNRGFTYYSDFSATGSIEFNYLYTLTFGASFGMSADNTNINSLVKIKYSPDWNLPMEFSVLYINNTIPEYSSIINSFMPVVSLNGSRAGISIGMNFRFSSYFYEGAQFESILSLYAYYNFINSDALKIGIGVGNFNNFKAGNMEAYSLNLDVVISLDENWSITSQFELMQSGIGGMSTNLYGFAWRGGARYSW